MTVCCSVLEMEWTSFVPSCQSVCVCGGGSRGKKKPAVKVENRLLCCNKNTWILSSSSSYQCWTEFCYIVRKETPLTDAGRVVIIGEPHRKQTTGRVGDGLLHSYLHFTWHSPSLVMNLHAALRSWEKNKTKRNKTANHESAAGTNCTAVAYTFGRREFRKSAPFGCRRPSLFDTYVFYMVLLDWEGKRELRFADRLEWLEICILDPTWASSRNFSFQNLYKSQTFDLLSPLPNNSAAASCPWGQAKTSSKCYLTAPLRIDGHSATVDDSKEFEGGKEEKGKQWLRFFFFFKQACVRMCMCVL